MKKYILLLMLAVSISIVAQVGIGTATPNSSAILELNTTNKGLLFPRTNLQSVNDGATVPNLVQGLCVYNTNPDLGLDVFCWNGSIWNNLQDFLISASRIGTIAKGATVTLEASSLKSIYTIDSRATITLPASASHGTQVQFYIWGDDVTDVRFNNVVTGVYGSQGVPTPPGVTRGTNQLHFTAGNKYSKFRLLSFYYLDGSGFAKFPLKGWFYDNNHNEVF
ncbi:MAG: hypothetical protein ACK5MD_10955 [Flavobacteriales bacterium]